MGPTSGRIGYISPGGQNQKWPTSGRIGYITPAVWGVPNALERGTKSEVAHKWADWLHHPCRMGGPQRFRAGNKIRRGPQVGGLATSAPGDKIRSGPQVGGLATSPLPYGGSPTL